MLRSLRLECHSHAKAPHTTDALFISPPHSDSEPTTAAQYSYMRPVLPRLPLEILFAYRYNVRERIRTFVAGYTNVSSWSESREQPKDLWTLSSMRRYRSYRTRSQPGYGDYRKPAVIYPASCMLSMTNVKTLNRDHLYPRPLCTFGSEWSRLD